MDLLGDPVGPLLTASPAAVEPEPGRLRGDYHLRTCALIESRERSSARQTRVEMPLPTMLPPWKTSFLARKDRSKWMSIYLSVANPSGPQRGLFARTLGRDHERSPESLRHRRRDDAVVWDGAVCVERVSLSASGRVRRRMNRGLQPPYVPKGPTAARRCTPRVAAGSWDVGLRMAGAAPQCGTMSTPCNERERR